MANKAQIREYEDILEQVEHNAKALMHQTERLIALRDAEWEPEDIAIIAQRGIVIRSAVALDRLRRALDKLIYTQADNYRAIRDSK